MSKRMTKPCRCRNCGNIYEENKSRADHKGYCSAKCLHEKARSLGYRKQQRYPQEPNGSEYDVLSRHGAIRSVFVDEEGRPKSE